MFDEEKKKLMDRLNRVSNLTDLTASENSPEAANPASNGLLSDMADTAVDAAVGTAKGAVSLGGELLEHPQDVLFLGATAGINALVNSANYLSDNLLLPVWDAVTGQKVTEYTKNRREAEKAAGIENEFDITARQMADFWGVGETQERHPYLSDFAGDAILFSGALGMVGKAFTTTGPVAKLAGKFGLSGEWAKKVLIDNEGIAEGFNKLKMANAQLSHYGVNPSSVINVGRAGAKMAGKVAKESFKETLYTTTALAASGYKHDQLFPEDATLGQEVFWWGVVPLVTGVGFPALGARYKTAGYFSKSNESAARNLNNMLNEQMVAKGFKSDNYKTENQQMANLLMDYGYAGNPAADVVTENMYTVKNLRTIKDKVIENYEKSIHSIPEVSANDIARHYDSLIDAARKRVDTGLDILMDANLPTESKSFIKKEITRMLDDYSNTLQGSTKLTEAPNTQAGLDAITGNTAAKLAKLKKRQKSDRVTEENKIKELEKIKTLEGTHYTLYGNGLAYDVNNFHTRWSDNPKNLKDIRYKTTKDGLIYDVNLTNNDFIDGPDFINISADTAGNIKTSRRKGFVYNLKRTETVAYDPAWQLLKKQKEYVINNQAELIKKDKSYDVDLVKASVPQLGYLYDLSKSMDSSTFTKLFKFNDKQVGRMTRRLSEQTGRDIESITMTDLLKQAYVGQSKYMMATRIGELVKNPYNLGRFSEESLVEELTGLRLKPNKDTGLANDVGESYNKFIDIFERTSKTADDVEIISLADRNPRRFVLGTSSEIAGLTDTINNQLMANLMERKGQRLDLLLNNSTIVGKFARLLNEAPQYANGYAQQVHTIGYGQDILGAAGRYLMTQEQRTQGNVALNAAISMNNQLKLAYTKVINDYLSPFTERAQKLIKNPDDVDAFSKLRHQSQSGWRLSEAAPVDLGDGKFGFLLDSSPESVSINKTIAERQARLEQKSAPEFGEYLPDPLNPSVPLAVSQDVAELAYMTHQHNSEMWEASEVINQSIGRQGGGFRNYWFPPKKLENVRIIGYTDSTGTFQPVHYASGPTPRQAEAEARLVMERAGFDKDHRYTIKTDKEAGLEKEFIREDIDANKFSWSDYSDSWRQQLSAKLSIDGTRVSQSSIIETGVNAMKDYIESLNHQMQLLGKRTRTAMMTDEINQARSLLATKKEGDLGYNELTQYIDALQGTKASNQGVHSKLYKAFDSLIDYGAKAISDFKNLSTYDRALELTRLEKGQMAQSRHMFDSVDEVKRIVGMKGEPIDEAIKAARLLGKYKSPKAQAMIGNLNRVITFSLLSCANLGYALLNIASLPMTIPMARRALYARLGETAQMRQARLGAYGKVLGNGRDIAVDLQGGLTETINHYMHNFKEFKATLAEAKELGVFSTQSQLIGESFIHPVETVFGRAGKTIANVLTKIPQYSEEVSRIIPYFIGFRLAQKAGLSKMECHAFSRKFMENCVGSYISSNKPLLMQDALGSLGGLFYTYNHNIIQQFLMHSLAGDKLAVATGLATQAALFGTSSIPGVDKLADYIFPIGSGKDLYTAMREKGLSDTEARALIYGGLSAWTGLDFSAKGTISSAVVPGMTTPPIFGMLRDVGEGLYDTVNAIASNNNVNNRLLWEIAQTHLPSPAVKSGINLAVGYKTSRDGNLVVDEQRVGKSLWWASNLLSMRTLDERMNRDALARLRKYEQQKQEKRNAIRRNMMAGLRSGKDQSEVIREAAQDAIANGISPKKVREFIKLGLIKATTTPAETATMEYAKKSYKSSSDANLAEAMRLIVFGNDAKATEFNNYSRPL